MDVKEAIRVMPTPTTDALRSQPVIDQELSYIHMASNAIDFEKRFRVLFGLACEPCECYSVSGRNSDGSEQDADVICERCESIAALSLS